MSTTNRDSPSDLSDAPGTEWQDLSRRLSKDGTMEFVDSVGSPIATKAFAATVEAVDESATSGRVADKKDHGKPRFSLVPQRTIWGLVAAFEYAAKKYQVEDPVANALRIENPRTRFYNGLHRHLSDWYAGRRLDDGPGGSGLPTLFLVLCNASLLLEVDATEANVMPAAQDLNDPLK